MTKIFGREMIVQEITTGIIDHSEIIEIIAIIVIFEIIAITEITEIIAITEIIEITEITEIVIIIGEFNFNSMVNSQQFDEVIAFL